MIKTDIIKIGSAMQLPKLYIYNNWKFGLGSAKHAVGISVARTMIGSKRM